MGVQEFDNSIRIPGNIYHRVIPMHVYCFHDSTANLMSVHEFPPRISREFYPSLFLRDSTVEDADCVGGITSWITSFERTAVQVLASGQPL